MSLRRAGQLAALMFLSLICGSCGQVYRPVVIPTTTVPPNPANFHEVFSLNANAPSNIGTLFQIDVSGDTDLGATSGLETPNHIGVNPTHAGLFANSSRLYVASAGSIYPGGVDVVSAFSPVSGSSVATGFGAVSTFTLPTGSLPVFVAATPTSSVYVAGFGSSSSSNPDCLTGCVAVLNISTQVVSRTVPVGVNPVSLAVTPNGTKVYVANQGSNSVTSLNTVDLSANTVTEPDGVTAFSGATPVWVVARGDSQKVYVLTQGDGNLVTIDTATDKVSSVLPVGGGANYIYYDPHLSRLYVTNPTTATVFVFSATGSTGDTPTQLAAIPFSAGPGSPCPNGCQPTSVAALADGSRFYVASFQTQDECTDAVVGPVPCIIPQITVLDAQSLTVKIPSIPLLMSPQFAAGQVAVPRLASCDQSPTTYQPAYVRFRMAAAVSADSSRAYASLCDGGVVGVVNTTTSTTSTGNNTPDTLVANLLAPFSANPAGANGEPPPQNPVFLFAGQ